MAIKSFKVSHVGPFRSRPVTTGAGQIPSNRTGYDIEIDLDKQVNLFIGPNNVGKSTILQTLAAVATRFVTNVSLPRSFTYATSDFSEEANRPGAEVWLNWDSPNGDYRGLGIILAWHIDRDDQVHFLSIRGPDGLQDVDGYEIDWEHLAQDFGYVGYHNPSSPPSLPLFKTLGLGLPKKAADDEDDPNVYETANLKRHGTQSARETAAEIDKVIFEITKGFEVKIGTGIFADDPHTDFVEWREGQNKFSTMDGELTFPELSHGTRSVFAWVTQLMLGMAQHYQYAEQWKQRRGVFIIDEIDAHLHPSWQRRIIPTLQRHFPNVQIFASTHSPMMVAGLKTGQVHLLKRDENGRVVWSKNEQDIIGWTADEIYRTFMGIEDPTDEITVQRANRLRTLRNKETRTEAEEDEMNNLRRQVNEDLLAKGPVDAQSERYSELMHRFLVSLESDLSQDGA